MSRRCAKSQKLITKSRKKIVKMVDPWNKLLCVMCTLKIKKEIKSCLHDRHATARKRGRKDRNWQLNAFTFGLLRHVSSYEEARPYMLKWEKRELTGGQGHGVCGRNKTSQKSNFACMKRSYPAMATRKLKGCVLQTHVGFGGRGGGSAPARIAMTWSPADSACRRHIDNRREQNCYKATYIRQEPWMSQNILQYLAGWSFL